MEGPGGALGGAKPGPPWQWEPGGIARPEAGGFGCCRSAFASEPGSKLSTEVSFRQRELSQGSAAAGPGARAGDGLCRALGEHLARGCPPGHRNQAAFLSFALRPLLVRGPGLVSLPDVPLRFSISYGVVLSWIGCR